MTGIEVCTLIPSTTSWRIRHLAGKDVTPVLVDAGGKRYTSSENLWLEDYFPMDGRHSSGSQPRNMQKYIVNIKNRGKIALHPPKTNMSPQKGLLQIICWSRTYCCHPCQLVREYYSFFALVFCFLFNQSKTDMQSKAWLR